MMTSGFGRNYIEVIRQRVVVFLDLRAGPPSARVASFFLFYGLRKFRRRGLL